MNTVDEAISEIKKGHFILIPDADDREGETDLVIASQFVTNDAVRRLRQDAGGLLCVTVHEKTYQKLDLPFMADIYCEMGQFYPVLRALVPNDIPYDAKSAFSVTINHRKTFTGITDNDRALTIAEFAKFCKSSRRMSKSEAVKEFGKAFRAPGHVTLLNAAEGLLDRRQGHTELTTALMVMAGLTPSATICERMADNGLAVSKADNIKWAKGQGLVMVDGGDIIGEWKRRRSEWSG